MPREYIFVEKKAGGRVLLASTPTHDRRTERLFPRPAVTLVLSCSPSVPRTCSGCGVAIACFSIVRNNSFHNDTAFRASLRAARLVLPPEDFPGLAITCGNGENTDVGPLQQTHQLMLYVWVDRNLLLPSDKMVNRHHVYHKRIFILQAKTRRWGSRTQETPKPKPELEEGSTDQSPGH